MENEVFKNFIKKTNEIANDLQDADQFVSPVFIQDFIDKSRRVKEFSSEIMETNRDLKIGIVGQVKAGKSSFLNALVFDGNDILPKAATPMTAALTKISYSQNPKAKIVFYTKKDWNVIESLSDKFDSELERQINAWKERKLKNINYDIDFNCNPYLLEPTEQDLNIFKQNILLQYRSCKELTELANCNEDILSKLDSEEELSLDNLVSDLQNYVGASGVYTPIVKYIELFINNDMVKGIQIVDTPGLGDPITSRSEKTKEFLMACDAVFLLSQTTQFMKREDIELIMSTLPGEGINRAVLVGSQFDSVMLDNSDRGKQPLKIVLRRTRDKLNDGALRALTDSRNAEKGYVHGKVLDNILSDVKKQIENERSLYYTTSLLYSSARHIERGEPLAENEEFILTEMENRFDGMSRNPEFLREFADIDRLRKIEFDKIRKEKENIILERSLDFAKKQAQALQGYLNNMQMEGEQNLHLIQSEDINSLKNKMATSQEALVTMRRDIKNTFEMCATEVKKYMVGMAMDVKNRTGGHKNINIAEESTTTPHSEPEGFFIFKTIRHWDEIKHYKVSNVEDAISNLHNFIHEAESAIARDMQQAIDINMVRNKIKDVVVRAFKKADANYDANDIIGPVEAVLARLTIPEFSIIDSQKYDREILEKFPNARVIGEEIAGLSLKQELVLDTIAQDISTKLEGQANNIATILNDQAINFTDDIKKQIEAKIELLTKNLQNQQESIDKYNKFLQVLNLHKQELREISAKL